MTFIVFPKAGPAGPAGPTGPSGIIAGGIAEIDFGAVQKNNTTLAITGQTTLAADSKISVDIAGIATVDHTVDEHLAAQIFVGYTNVIPGTGFTILAIANQLLTGKFSVAWSWG